MTSTGRWRGEGAPAAVGFEADANTKVTIKMNTIERKIYIFLKNIIRSK